MRELRFGMHEPGLIKAMADGAFAGKILTFAPGLEATPIHESIKGGSKVQQVKTLGKGLNNYASLTLEQAIQAARLHTLVTMQLAPGKRPLRIEVMTDFGFAGADYIRENKTTAIGSFKNRTNRHELKMMWAKYGIKDRKTQDEIVKRLNDGNRDQEKMLELGRLVLKAIKDTKTGR
jgi:hypothetical protein